MCTDDVARRRVDLTLSMDKGNTASLPQYAVFLNLNPSSRGLRRTARSFDRPQLGKVNQVAFVSIVAIVLRNYRGGDQQVQDMWRWLGQRKSTRPRSLLSI